LPAEPFTHGPNGRLRVGHNLSQGFKLGEHMAPFVQASLRGSRYGYAGYRSSISNRVPESVNGAGRVDNGWGEETLALNLADGLSESEVVLIVLEAARLPAMDPQDGHSEVREVSGHANDVLPDFFVTAAVQNEQQFHIDADLAKKMVPVRRIVRLVNHRIRVYGFPLSAARLDGF
jgi:hypothetical protein